MRHRHRVVILQKLSSNSADPPNWVCLKKWGWVYKHLRKSINQRFFFEEQFNSNGIKLVSSQQSLWADELALPWGINPCSVLPHGMCIRRLSITRTTLVETLCLLEVVELLTGWFGRFLLGSQQGKLLVDFKKNGQVVHFCTMKCHNGACVSPSYWFFECYHLISMRVKVYSHPLFPQQAHVAGLYLGFDGLLPEHYNHFSVLKILIPWQKIWKSELLLFPNMSQAGKKKHNMSQGDEIFQLGVVIQECQCFFCVRCVCVNCEKVRPKNSSRIEVAHFDRLASKIAATWSPFWKVSWKKNSNREMVSLKFVELDNHLTPTVYTISYQKNLSFDMRDYDYYWMQMDVNGQFIFA